jgi:tRNA(Ile)-lysidine synthase TilS/MesJ
MAKTTEKHVYSASESRFMMLVEKRIRKCTRLNQVFKKGDKILVLDALDEFFLRSITSELPVEIYSKKAKNVKFTKIIKQWTADDEINVFLKQIFYGKKEKKETFLKLLKVITDEEAEKFAKLKGIAFKPNPKDKLVQEFVDRMNAKYPDTKYKLIKSIEILSKF